MNFDSLSILMIWTAVAIYAAAFIAYAFDLAKRSQVAADAKAVVPERELVGAAVGAPTSSAGRATGSGGAGKTAPAPQRFVMARIGTALTTLGFLFHLAGTVLRGVAAGRVPWSNMYEFSMTGTLLIIAVYIAVNIWFDLKYLGTFIVGLVVVLLGGAATGFYVEVVPLADPLKSVWLVIHVFVASLGTAFFALAFALSVFQLMQARREAKVLAEAPKTGPRFLATLPSAERLEGLAYRFATVGFIFWTFTLIAGSIWANDAWGRYWGFDTKETWTFIIWVLYAGYIHARATRGWRGSRSAWLSIVGFAAVLFNFTIVNLFFKGLHVYSGLS
ncbi:MAG: c-type cytochrome biogenesis protein CcsB [Microbacterium sp.]|jgi:cytochrome c-type biogenesis protein CcsB|uniref:c-type cytochrome biogenesis protein CcsB n=1 Tax=Microbacterium sp. TaxID=51671 RepID=UPI00282FA3DD|nr:c-type cytochrome biogenesis protein CcsB [Microbacterium sp.]MDR2322721.1 c-type cytochrome biogenesis protein CcsB [Microbacterium sp.]